MRQIFIIIAFLSTTACSKDHEYTTRVSGVVLNYGSKEPIDSVLIGLKDGVGASGFSVLPASTDKRSVTYTDADGRFDIELSGEYGAFLFMEKEGYEFTNIEVKPYEDGDHDNEVLEMYAPAFFNPYFVSNTTNKNFSIKMPLVSKSTLGSSNYRFDFPGGVYEFEGEGPHQLGELFGPYKGIGDTYIPYRMTVERNGKTTVNQDSVYIKSFETYRDTIYY